MAGVQTTFDRWKPTRVRTLAYRVFEFHHAEVNNSYWAHRAAFRGAFSLIGGKAETDFASVVFPNPDNERRNDVTLGEWADSYNQFDKWVRLSSLMAMTGYLEVFVKHITEAACQSSPAVMLGGQREIDGVKLLKTRKGYGFVEQTELCTRGTWQGRAEQYEKLFGTCPAVILDNVGELDKLQAIRNSVGHSFGRKLKPAAIGRTRFWEKPQGVSQDSLKKYLGLVHQVAQAIEDHLGEAYVGCYETLAAYHYWESRGAGHTEEMKAFRDFFNAEMKVLLSVEYFAELVAFYHRA